MLKFKLFIVIILTCSSTVSAQWGKIFPKFISIFKTHTPTEITQVMRRMGTSSTHFSNPNEVVRVLENNSLIYNRREKIWYKPSPYTIPSTNPAIIDNEDDAIVFQSEKEREAFKYVENWQLLNGNNASDQLASFNQFINDLKRKDRIVVLDPENTRFKNAVKKAAAFQIMDDFILKGAARSDLTYGIMSFQKAYGVPITGILDNMTIDIMERLVRHYNLYYDVSRPFMLSHRIKDPLTKKLSEMNDDEWMKRNYFIPEYFSDLLTRKEWSREVSASDRIYLKHLATKGLLPTQNKLCTNLAVQTGIFKFQKQQKLPLTGVLDLATNWKILEDKSGLPLTQKLPNYPNHIELPIDLVDPGSLEVIPYISTHNVALAKYSGIGFASSEVFNQNVIFMKDAVFRGFKYHEELRAKFNSFLKMLPDDLTQYPSTAFLLTMKVNTLHIATIIYLKNNRLVGYILKGAYNPLEDQLKYIKENNYQFVWAGDDFSFDFQSVIDGVGLPTLRRIPQVKAKLDVATVISKSGFKAGNAIACNAIPFTTAQLKLGGFSALGLDKWVKFRHQTNGLIAGKFSDQISTAAALRQEIISGEKDILTIIAHSDTRRLYIGDEAINIDDINSWENRAIPLTKKRNAVLLICNAGNTKLQKGIIFRERVASISEILLNKGYFNSVIAPDHEINEIESLQILSAIVKNEKAIDIRKRFKGWQEYVKRKGEINKQYITSLN